MRAETQVPSSRRPSVEATAAPVTEAAVVETPTAEAPVVESAIMEETPAEAPTTTPSLPAPMETGGAGDGPSWVEQAEEVEEEPFQHSRLVKHPRSLSRRQEPNISAPIPRPGPCGEIRLHHVAVRTCRHTTRHLSQHGGQGDQVLAP